MVPRGVTPLYLQGDDLVYITGVEGHYYGLRIGANGDLKIVNPSSRHQSSQPVNCPRSLTRKFAQFTPPPRAVPGHLLPVLLESKDQKIPNHDFWLELPLEAAKTASFKFGL